MLDFSTNEDENRGFISFLEKTKIEGLLAICRKPKLRVDWVLARTENPHNFPKAKINEYILE